MDETRSQQPVVKVGRTRRFTAAASLAAAALLAVGTIAMAGPATASPSARQSATSGLPQNYCNPTSAPWCIESGTYSVDLIGDAGSITGGYLNGDGTGSFTTNGGYVGTGTITNATVTTTSVTANVSIDGYSGTGTLTGSPGYGSGFSGEIGVYWEPIIGEIYLHINNMELYWNNN